MKSASEISPMRSRSSGANIVCRPPLGLSITMRLSTAISAFAAWALAMTRARRSARIASSESITAIHRPVASVRATLRAPPGPRFSGNSTTLTASAGKLRAIGPVRSCEASSTTTTSTATSSWSSALQIASAMVASALKAAMITLTSGCIALLHRFDGAVLVDFAQTEQARDDTDVHDASQDRSVSPHLEWCEESCDGKAIEGFCTGQGDLGRAAGRCHVPGGEAAMRLTRAEAAFGQPCEARAGLRHAFEDECLGRIGGAPACRVKPGKIVGVFTA